MIEFKSTRNIDLIEAVGNHPDIIAGSNNGDGFDYQPGHRYFEVHVHGQFGGIIYFHEIQPLTFDCHAMYLKEVRGFSQKIGSFLAIHSGELQRAMRHLIRRAQIPSWSDLLHDAWPQARRHHQEVFQGNR